MFTLTFFMQGGGGEEGRCRGVLDRVLKGQD